MSMKENIQPTESLIPINPSNGGLLDVVSVWETIQGEGPLAGTPAVFVRLAGCNLQCRLCDTDYTTDRKNYRPIDLVAFVNEKSTKRNRLIVLTGGEPLRQDIGPFCRDLWAYDFEHLQIETNGTLAPRPEWEEQHWWREAIVVCSPKSGINRKLQPKIKALKYVLQAGEISASDGLPNTTLGNSWRVGRHDPMLCNPEIYVQPLDEQDEQKNKANLEATLQSCFKFGYRFCLQVHKVINLE